ncbi:MAG: phage holin family protein, partial [Erythrobacter sp.]
GKAAAALVLALVLLNIALTALAIGAVLALQPLITIWGAIAVVVGALLVGTGLLVRSARARGRVLAAMFGDGAGA